MVLLDTSGSMLANQNNDGSPLCNNNATGQTSRIFHIKNAMRAALAQVGTDEANFGLGRFPQIENTATTNCPAAHWSNGRQLHERGRQQRLPDDQPQLVGAGDDLRALVRHGRRRRRSSCP